MKHFACAFAMVWSYQVVRADEAPQPPAAESPREEKRSDDLHTLAEKLEELRALQVEVDRLRQQTRQAASILFEIKIAEVSHAEMAADQRGEAAARSLIEQLTTDDDTRGAAKGILSESGKELLDKLRAQAILKVVSEPSIITVAERPASMHVGGEVALPVGGESRDARVRYIRYGTSIDIVPIVLDDQKLRLELRLRLAQLDFANSIEIAGKTYPGLISRSIDFAAEAPIGQTVAVVLPPAIRQAKLEGDVVGEGQRAGQGEAVETLVLVTPRWVEPMASVRPVKPIYGPPKLSAPHSEARVEQAPFQVPSYRVRR